jgi:hypothetical protein
MDEAVEARDSDLGKTLFRMARVAIASGLPLEWLVLYITAEHVALQSLTVAIGGQG